MSESIQLIRLTVVLEITGLSKTGLYEAIKERSFPQQVKINSRSSTWVRQEVEEWIKGKIEAREVSI